MKNAKKILQLDLNLLKIFEALYVEQNMSVVAHSLFITPSAVSHAITRLRTALDDPLFVRKGQSMQPTPTCQRMAPRLIETLHKLRHILQQGGQFNPEETEQTFKIAIPEALEALFIPSLIEHIVPLLPRATFACVNLQRPSIARQLTFGEIDFAIDVARPMKLPIMHKKLSDDALVVLSNRALSPQQLSLETYLGADHITVSNRPVGRVLEDFALLQKGYNRKVKLRCQTYQTARDILLKSNLMLTLPNILAQRLLTQDLQIHALPFAMDNIETHIYWDEAIGQDQAIIWLRQQILQVFGLIAPSNGI